MEMSICVAPFNGEMKVYVKCNKSDIKHQYFYINRDVAFESFLCDGRVVEVEVYSVAHPMFDGYITRKVMLPIFNESLEIRYSLRLSGDTGCCPYVRETIAPEFTFICCYPQRLRLFCLS